MMNKSLSYSCLGICLIIIFLFFYIIYKNSVNIPNGDDLFCLLIFTQTFQDTTSWIERFFLLMQQWIEHRIVYSRLTALLSYTIHGRVNFITILMIGNACLLGFTILFWKLIRGQVQSFFYLIPIVCILFSPVTYEANMWAGASTVYMPVCLFALVSLYLLPQSGIFSFIGALLVTLLATFSFGNGMFAFVAGLFLLVLQRYRQKAIIWAFTTSMAISLYFSHLEQYSSTNAFGFSSHFKYPAYLAFNLFGFVGGIIDHLENINNPFQNGNIPAQIAGLLVTALLLVGVFFYSKQIFNHPGATDRRIIAWVGMVVFIGITALAMAYSRTDGQAMNTLSSRYKIYSMVCFLLLYAGCLFYFPHKKMIGILFGVLSTSLLGVHYYMHYGKLVQYKSNFLSGLYNYHTNHQWIIYRNTAYYERASRIICDSVQTSKKPVYTFSKVYPELTHKALSNAPVLKQVQVSAPINSSSGLCIQMSSQDYPSSTSSSEGLYLVLYNDQNIYLLVANPIKNKKWKLLTTGHYFQPGFQVTEYIDSTFVQADQYHLAIFCPSESNPIKRISNTLNRITDTHGKMNYTLNSSTPLP